MSNPQTLNHFNQVFRPSANSTKHQPSLLSSGKLFAMDIADMDFAVDPAIKQKFIDKLSGCSDFSYKSFDVDGGSNAQLAIQEWYRTKRGVSIKPSWIRDCPSVVQALVIALLATTNEHDPVLLVTPAYKKFIEVVAHLKRRCVFSKMVQNQGRFELNIPDIVSKIDGVRMVIMSNPHNPYGRVFSKKQLQPVLDAVARNTKTVYFSDEIFADIAFNRFETALGYGLPPEQLIIADSPSKAFNVMSLQCGYSVIPGEVLRKQYAYWQRVLRVSHTQPAMLMLEVCYAPDIGPAWLSSVKQLIQDNLRLLNTYVSRELPQLAHSTPEAGYFVVLDFGKFIPHHDQLKTLLNRTGIIGESLGLCYKEVPIPSCQLRINLAVPPEYLRRALTALKRQIKALPAAKL